MRKTQIPRTHLHASTLALGTDYLGTTVSREDSMRLMDRYVEAGGNVIDTAEMYARWLPGGDHQSEQVIGEWLRERPGLRDRLIISTKGAHPVLTTERDTADDALTTVAGEDEKKKAEIEADLDSSLQRLGIECVDLYWLHRDAPGYPIEEILQTMESFRRAGKIRHAGFSNWTHARASEAFETARKLGVEGFVASQNLWSLAEINLAAADPTAAFVEAPFARWHAEHQFAAFPYLSHANGYFRRLERGTLDQVPPDSRARGFFDNPENRQRFERIRHVQEKYGYTLGQVVLGYLTNHPFPVFPLVGPKTLADLEDSLASVDAKLSAEDLAYLADGPAGNLTAK